MLWIPAKMKITTLKKVQFNSASMNLDAINIAYGMENTQTVDDDMECAVKKFAKDTVKIIRLSEKIKLMHIQAETGCKGNRI